MELLENIIALFLDESVKGWARVAIFAILAFSSVALYWMKGINSRTKGTEKKIDQIDKTLNTNNGGSHVLDLLQRLEVKMDEQTETLAQHTDQISGFDDRLGQIEDGSLTRFWAPFGKNRDN